MIINHNLPGANAISRMNANSVNASKSMQKLSSGLRINSAADDAAGLAISEKMRGQIRGLDTASANAQDGISMIQTAEGALNETTSILQRMRELATQSANDTNVGQDRTEVQKEINQLTSEINRIGNTTEFNTQKVLNGGSGQKANIRYTVLATGDPANSSATGTVSTMNIATSSIKAGTAAISNFTTATASQKAADDGKLGSPFIAQTHSTLAGTGKASAVTETVKGGVGAVTHTVVNTAVQNTTSGEDTYKLDTNFSAGNTIQIAGQTFTAVDASKTTLAAGEFKVGATTTDTITNLAATINNNAAITGLYTVTSSGDTLNLKETDNTDVTLSNAGAETISAGTSKAQYALEITSNFTAGDKLKIGDVTYTAGTDFTIGADVAATVTNIKTAIEAANDANDTAYDITTTDPTWTGSDDNNILVFTAKAAGVDANAADMNASAVTNTPATQGVYKFEVKVNFEEGQKIKVGDVELTAGTANTATSFAVGADVDTTASNIKAALDAAKTAGKLSNYTVGAMGTGIDADTITLTEVAATGKDLAAPTVTDIVSKAGVSTFDLSTDFSTGDKISIDGVDLVAGTDFNIGSSVSDTASNLMTAINNNSTLNAKYTATTANTAFITGNKIVLTEKGSNIDGVNLAAPTITKATAQAGSYEFLVTKNLADKDRIAIDGRGLTAGTDFAVGADVNETAANIKAAIEKDSSLKDKFTVSVSTNKITLTEKVASGANIVAPSISAGAVAGKFEFSMNALTKGTKINIDGTELTLAKGGSETETGTELKSLVEGNSTLNSKYSVTVDGTKVSLTQKAGAESATAPTLSYQTKAGSGYKAQMQIGANTGQSMEVDLNDMRALALGVSQETSVKGQTVEVDGKEYEVAWTATGSVTNGTDNVASEFALDVSNHDNATAAVKVINDAINTVSSERSKLGAYQNRLEHTINNLGTSSENLTSAESRIRDVDMAKEMSTYSKNNILAQAAQAMIAQANQQPQQVLQLLR